MTKFNLEAFNKENPIIEIGEDLCDPFVERVNAKELGELKTCWHCLQLFDPASGLPVKEADYNGESSPTMETCSVCKRYVGGNSYGW